MKKILLLLVLSVGSLFAQLKGDMEVPYISYEIKMGHGFDTVQANCLMCHSFGYILNQGPQSRAFWEGKIHKMIHEFKAPIEKKDQKIITDYLFKHYGNGKVK
jgi:hypothetical protein